MLKRITALKAFVYLLLTFLILQSELLSGVLAQELQIIPISPVPPAAPISLAPSVQPAPVQLQPSVSSPQSGQALQPSQMSQSGQAMQPAQMPQSGQTLQPGQTVQQGQAVQAGQTLQPNLTGQSGQTAQPGQPTQQGQPMLMGQMTQPAAPELSEFEKYVSGKSPSEISMQIRQFGHDFFSAPSTTFAPGDKLPVGPEYVIGPGDEIKISIWGKIQANWNVVVERNGTITLPTIGNIGVSGLTFKELRELLHREASKYYTGFEMSVSMGSLRTIMIYIVGNAVKPGTYTVSSLSTIISALFEAGGPNRNGSMRDIQLIRKGSAIVHLDLYDFLLKGDMTKDVRLLSEDIIFIPTVGRRAGVAGNVTRPAIYEMKQETKLSDLIAMSGGISATGYMQRIQVESIFQHEVKKVFDTSFADIAGEKDIQISDGDIVKIFQITNVVVNSVVLKGNAARPGQYQWFQGMKVSDLIKNSEKDLLPETYFDHALIERFIPPDYHKEIISVDLRKALTGKDPHDNILLKPYDALTVYSKWEFLERPRIRISGSVNKPGDYELKKNMKISDLIKLAGGLKYFAFAEKAELTRVKPTDKGPKTEFIDINLRKALAEDETNNITLYENDYLFVRNVPEWDLYKTVTIYGEVTFPGTYTIRKDEKLSSLFERAGGFTSHAYLRGAVFTRESVRQLQQQQIDEMVDRLQRELLSVSTASVNASTNVDDANMIRLENEQKKAFLEKMRTIKAKGRISVRLPNDMESLKTSIYDVTLNEGDTIFIPSDPKTIQVIGSVYNQTAFVYDKDKGLSDYVDLAGGYTENADAGGTYILMADGTAEKGSSGFLGLNWNRGSKRWDSGGSGIGPGDTIIVPEKLERVPWLRNVKDITQIIYQLAVSAAVAIKMF